MVLKLEILSKSVDVLRRSINVANSNVGSSDSDLDIMVDVLDCRAVPGSFRQVIEQRYDVIQNV